MSAIIELDADEMVLLKGMLAMYVDEWGAAEGMEEKLITKIFAADEQSDVNLRTCATCNAMLAAGPQPAMTYEQAAPDQPMMCEACGSQLGENMVMRRCDCTKMQRAVSIPTDWQR